MRRNQRQIKKIRRKRTFCNIITGEIIRRRFKFQAVRYFKSDGKMFNYEWNKKLMFEYKEEK